MSSDGTAFDDVGRLGARLANLRAASGYALGAETRNGMLDVAVTGAALDLPAPRDMDDLLLNGLGAQVRAGLDPVA